MARKFSDPISLGTDDNAVQLVSLMDLRKGDLANMSFGTDLVSNKFFSDKEVMPLQGNPEPFLEMNARNVRSSLSVREFSSISVSSSVAMVLCLLLLLFF